MKKHHLMNSFRSSYRTIVYMIHKTVQLQKKVALFCILQAILHVFLNLAELLVVPALLHLIEIHAPISRILWVLGGFILFFMILGAIMKYIEQNESYPIARLNMTLEIQNLKRRMQTSFPNTEDPAINAIFGHAENTIFGEDGVQDLWINLRVLIESGLGLIIYLCLMGSLQWGLIAIVIATSVFGFVISQKYNEWRKHRMDAIGRLFNRMSRIAEYERDNAYAKDMWLYNMHPWMKKLFYDTQRDYRTLSFEIEKQRFKGESMDIFMGLIRNALAYIYLLRLTIQRSLNASTFLLYFSAITGLAGWITSITSAVLKLERIAVNIAEIQKTEMLPEPFLLDSGDSVPISTEYEITLDHVTFTYPSADQPTIRDFSLTIPAGEKLAIVGENGAGKSTLINLICGLYDPTEGRVLINGRDVRTLNRNEYYELFAAVFQEYALIDGSLAENLMPSGVPINEKMRGEILEQSGFMHKYRSFPAGMDTLIGRSIHPEGTELSGGEKQRLLLARALCKKAHILLLDEPTAALDPIAEHEIYTRYNEITNGSTAIFISHRLASTRFCDRILFLEQGTILEQGTHEELLAANGKYAEFYEVQSRYYREGDDLT